METLILWIALALLPGTPVFVMGATAASCEESVAEVREADIPTTDCVEVHLSRPKGKESSL